MSVRVDPEVLRNEAAIRGLSMRDLGKKAALSDATMSNAAAGAALRSPEASERDGQPSGWIQWLHAR